MPVPHNRQEILSFLGLAGFLCIWIPNFASLAPPLYQAAKGNLHKPLDLSSVITTPFLKLKNALFQRPALTLPDPIRPFTLYTAERQNLALGALGQTQGPSFQPVAYLSKQLPPVTKSPCLWALASVQSSTKRA